MGNTDIIKWIIFAIALTGQSILYSYLISNSSYCSTLSSHSQQQPNTKSPKIQLHKIVASKPKILLWTRMWFVPGKVGYFLDDASWQKCPVTCDIIEDKKRLSEADALIFHARDLEGNTTETIPNRIRSSQIFVFYTMESPVYLANWTFIPRNVFNWTLTYRLDSDIPEPYGWLEFQKSSASYNYRKHKSSTINYNLFTFPPKMLRKYKDRYLRGKDKLVGWIVTRCETSGKREDIVKELQEHIPVDIFGQCGNLSCKASRKKNPYDCYKELGRGYKFYLSFENSLCTDYVSEKFFQALDNNMIPIVYGSVNYSLIAPPGSYIDVRDYPTIRKLAQYIQYLDINPEEYLKYFLWKEKYRVQHRIKFCNLCLKLWQHSVIGDSGKRVLNPKYKQTKPDIEKWWIHTKYNNIGSKKTLNSTACVPPFPISINEKLTTT